jgi:hypothetical protein
VEVLVLDGERSGEKGWEKKCADDMRARESYSMTPNQMTFIFSTVYPKSTSPDLPSSTRSAVPAKRTPTPSSLEILNHHFNQCIPFQYLRHTHP